MVSYKVLYLLNCFEAKVEGGHLQGISLYAQC